MIGLLLKKCSSRALTRFACAIEKVWVENVQPTGTISQEVEKLEEAERRQQTIKNATIALHYYGALNGRHVVGLKYKY